MKHARVIDLSSLVAWAVNNLSWEVLTFGVFYIWRHLGEERRRKIGFASAIVGVLGALTVPLALAVYFLPYPYYAIGTTPLMILSYWKIDGGYEYSPTALKVIVDRATSRFMPKRCSQ